MPDLNLFIEMSEEFCGIPAFHLVGTGYAGKYLETVVGVVGEDCVVRLLNSYRDLPKCCQQKRNAAIRAEILAHDEIGTVARNIIKLWYTATWLELPKEWLRKYRMTGDNCSFVPDPYAYPESLLGPAIGAHPAGAKPTGHQSWALPPTYLPFAKQVAPAECNKHGCGRPGANVSA
jgi:hypothetical protein